MSRRIIREARQSARKQKAPIGLEGEGDQQAHVPMDQGGGGHRRVRCSAPWARRFVPGSIGHQQLPVGTALSSLARPLDRHVWVARYKNAGLQDRGLRPTRSKTFGGDVPEHLAFQVVLEWIWNRYELSMGGKPEERPLWVKGALAPCELCTQGKPCSMLDDARKACTESEGQDVAADTASDWSGEGSSEAHSSDDAAPPQHVHRPRANADTARRVHRPRAQAVEPLPTALLVGDSNAVGYCTTQPWAGSLANALGTHFQVTLAGKSGATWVMLANDTSAVLTDWAAKCIKKSHGNGIVDRSFSAVIVVLGTNDIPKKTRVVKATWTRLFSNSTVVWLHGFCWTLR